MQGSYERCFKYFDHGKTLGINFCQLVFYIPFPAITMKKKLSLFKVSLLIASCMFASSAHSEAETCIPVTKTQVAEKLGALSLLGVLNLEAAPCGIWLEKDGVAFSLKETNPLVNKGVRSEVAIGFPFEEQDTVRYSWEVKFPDDFSADFPDNRWWLIGQWHDQPDPMKGEKWADFPSRSPPVAIYIEEKRTRGKAGEEHLGLGIVMNGNEKKTWVEVPKGRWLKISATIHWSTGKDGSIDFDVENYFSGRIAGTNMHNSYRHYLKLGQYRNKGIAKEDSVLIRNVQISQVGPAR